MTWSDRNIIFIFSLPRAGSTLLQRLLTTHPAIRSTAETWLLLPQIYALRRGRAFAEYSHMAAAAAIADFCAVLPGGVSRYNAELRDFALRLFQAGAGDAAAYFLEKTPRNTLIADQLVEIFPHSKFIFLWRNPLACAASMIETFSGGRWNLFRYGIDLFQGLDTMVKVYQAAEVDKLALRYEDLTASPAEAAARIFDFLELDFRPEQLGEIDTIRFQGRMGDPTGVHNYRSISTEPLHKWKATLANPLRRAWARRYLEWLGPERLAVMGYDAQALREELAQMPFSLRQAGPDLIRMGYGALERRSPSGC